MDGVRWSVVLPVKPLSGAKTRLAVPDRHRLALAMTLDTAAVAARCPSVGRVVAVCDDPEASAGLRRLGVVVVVDRPGSGLNPALRYGAGVASGLGPADGTVALAADLPALRVHELAAALEAALAHPRAFVADLDGGGTTLLSGWPGVPLDPRFGPGSRTAHRESGAVELLLPDLAGLRRDVDTATQLATAVSLGVGPRMRGVLGGDRGCGDRG